MSFSFSAFKCLICFIILLFFSSSLEWNTVNTACLGWSAVQWFHVWQWGRGTYGGRATEWWFGSFSLFFFFFSLLSCSIIMSIKLGRCGQEACVHVRYGRDIPIPIPIPVFFPCFCWKEVVSLVLFKKGCILSIRGNIILIFIVAILFYSIIPPNWCILCILSFLSPLKEEIYYLCTSEGYPFCVISHWVSSLSLPPPPPLLLPTK